MNNKIDTNTNEMEANTKRMENKMDGNTKKMEEMRGEMQKMGQGLQAGIMALAYDETQKWRRRVLRRTSWGGVQRLSGPRWRRVRTG